MAIGVRLRFAGATLEQYDTICGLMGLTPRGPGPAGMLYHWAAEDDGAFLVTDVWRNRESFDEFGRTQIGPLTQQAGITTEPDTTFYNVHNYLTAPEGTGAATAPTAVVMDFDGSLEQYDEVIDLMGFTPKGAGAPGGLFHWVTEISGGLRVTDVWKDRQTFDDFSEHQIRPYTAKVGVAAPTSVKIYEVHNYLTAGA
jgi:hypothetical protein